MKNLIALKKRSAVVSVDGFSRNASTHARTLVYTLQANVMSLGFMLDETVLDYLASKNDNYIRDFSQDLVCNLRSIKGADVVYRPMYPNFPRQVMEASDVDLFVNAIFHYLTYGRWVPDYAPLPRQFAFEDVNFRKISLITESDFQDIFTQLVTTNDSLSTEDREFIKWFLDTYPDLKYPTGVTYKEVACILAGHSLMHNAHLPMHLVQTATDVMRVATFLSDGDTSLTLDTKYKSFPRRIRRTLVKALEQVITEEDIARHASKWVRLAHALHVGDYSKSVYDIIKKVRENETLTTFNSRVEAYIREGDMEELIDLLSTRPGVFARRLDEVIRLARRTGRVPQTVVVESFLSVVGEVSTRVLLQLLGHFNQRGKKSAQRVAFPKGNMQKAVVFDALKPLSRRITLLLCNGISDELVNRFSVQESLGNVFIDPLLSESPIPTQQRSASSGLVSVARGTRLPLTDKNTLRFFIYWKGRDIDLSATLHDENFNMVDHVSYTKLRSQQYEACHSGDITFAPNGACEFIDITLDKLKDSGVRYIAMNVFVYSGPMFAEHEVCYAGWMTRDYPDRNEVFDPKTVEQKIDLRSESYNSIPVIFDVMERKAIWADLVTKSRYHYWGNNVHSNQATIEQVMSAVVDNSNKVSLFDLFGLHAKARGQLVFDPREADTVFSLHDGITPFDINTIQSEFISG